MSSLYVHFSLFLVQLFQHLICSEQSKWQSLDFAQQKQRRCDVLELMYGRWVLSLSLTHRDYECMLFLD
jgi:hypothetical protein